MFKNIKRLLIKLYFVLIKKDYCEYARYLGVRIGERCQILSDPYVVFGSEPWLVEIGNHVEVTQRVQFITHDGALWTIREMEDRYKNADVFGRIKVGNNVMIGMRSIIMPGVTIGNNVVIGAGSVVNKNIPDNSIVAGVPAKVITSIDEYASRLDNKAVVFTKNMSVNEKKEYLEELYPELLGISNGETSYEKSSINL